MGTVDMAAQLGVAALRSQPRDGESFGASIRARRVAAGLSQRQVARLVGVSKESVMKWEWDLTGIKPANVARLEQVLRNAESGPEGPLDHDA